MSCAPALKGAVAFAPRPNGKFAGAPTWGSGVMGGPGKGWLHCPPPCLAGLVWSQGDCAQGLLPTGPGLWAQWPAQRDPRLRPALQGRWIGTLPAFVPLPSHSEGTEPHQLAALGRSIPRAGWGGGCLEGMATASSISSLCMK